MGWGGGWQPVKKCLPHFVGSANTSSIGHLSQTFKGCILQVAATEAQVPERCTDSFQKDTGDLEQAKGRMHSQHLLAFPVSGKDGHQP